MFASFFIILLTILSLVHFVFIKPQARQQQCVVDYLQRPLTHSLANTIINREEEMVRVGSEIEHRASELAINSAQVAFFVEQLATDIENSGDDASRVAVATEQLVASTKEINKNAATSAQ